MILSFKALAAAGLAASVATGGAIATHTPSGSQPSAATASPAQPADVLTTLAVGEEAHFSAADAGEVVVVRTADGLELKGVSAAAGWSHEVEESAGPEIEVKFFVDGRRVDLNIELEDGSIRVRVRQRLGDFRADDDGDDTTNATVPTTGTTFEDKGDDDEITTPTTPTTFDDRGDDDRDGDDRITTSTTFDDRGDDDGVTTPTTPTTFDDGDDDGHDNSGPGGDDNSGPGGGDDSHSGPGSGDDDHSGSGHGSDG